MGCNSELGYSDIMRAEDERRCPAEYDRYGSKRCTLSRGHVGRHRAEWSQVMMFDHDYRDPAAADWLD